MKRLPECLAIAGMAALLALLVVAFSTPSPAHSWYEGYESPTGLDCCGEDDCFAVQSRWNAERQDFDVLLDEQWSPVDWSIVTDQPGRDPNWHACIWGGRLRCIIAPAFGS